VGPPVTRDTREKGAGKKSGVWKKPMVKKQRFHAVAPPEKRGKGGGYEGKALSMVHDLKTKKKRGDWRHVTGPSRAQQKSRKFDGAGEDAGKRKSGLREFQGKTRPPSRGFESTYITGR